MVTTMYYIIINVGAATEFNAAQHARLPNEGEAAME